MNASFTLWEFWEMRTGAETLLWQAAYLCRSPRSPLSVWGPGLEICISENSSGSSSVQSDWDWSINQLDICPKKNKVRKKSAPNSLKPDLCLFSSLSLISVVPPPPPVSFERPAPFRANFIRVTAKYPSPYFQMNFMLQAEYTRRHTCPVCGSLQNEFHE